MQNGIEEILKSHALIPVVTINDLNEIDGDFTEFIVLFKYFLEMSQFVSL